MESKRTSRDWLRIIANIAFVFSIGGLVGWLYEVFICGPLNNEPVNLAHGGLGIPFLSIYAIGAIMIELAFGLGRKQKSWVWQIVLSALLCTAMEYASGLLLLHVVGVQTWDYRLPGWDFLCTPDGLVCLRASLTFGIMGMLQLRFFDSWFQKAYEAGGIAKKSIVAVSLAGAGIAIAAILNQNVFHVIDVGSQWV